MTFQNRSTLTITKFNEIPAGEVFAKGTEIDDPAGLHVANSGKELKWVAVKGFNNDWCIYCHWATVSYDYVESNGDKVTLEHNIQKVVPCTKEVFARYRF